MAVARFLLDEAGCDRIETIVSRHWPVRIVPSDLGNPALWQECREARARLIEALGFVRGEV